MESTPQETSQDPTTSPLSTYTIQQPVQPREEEEKKDERDKYHNEVYTYQKLRSLKWMGGVYKGPNDDS